MDLGEMSGVKVLKESNTPQHYASSFRSAASSNDAAVFLSIALPLKLIELVLVSLFDIDNAYKMGVREMAQVYSSKGPIFCSQQPHQEPPNCLQFQLWGT